MEIPLSAKKGPFGHWLGLRTQVVFIYFLILKSKSCTTISHVPQKANITEAGKGPSLCAVCKGLL
jgi:hypothetical protein